MNAPKLNRKLHRWGSILTALPLVVVIATGIVLQLKKESSWVQPPTQRGSEGAPTIAFERILQETRKVPQANVASWEDIDRLDVRVDRNLVKVRCKNSWEVQLDGSSGAILQVAYRRSDWLESLHDGSWFGDPVKLWVFLPVAIVLLGLWITGVYLWFLPHLVRHRKRRERTTRSNP